MDNATLYGSIRLRPVRIAYLVRPTDKKSIDEIFRTNCCLWGGIYNPIIPYFERVPKWWSRHDKEGLSATQIIEGYLEYFEPDIIVECEKDLAKDIGFDPKKVIPLSKVLMRETASAERGDEDKGYGQSVFDIYRDLYKKEFQYVRRRKSSLGIFTAEDKSFDAYVAAVYGDFPKQRTLKYFKQGYKEAFEPTDYIVNKKSIETIYKSPPLLTVNYYE